MADGARPGLDSCRQIFNISRQEVIILANVIQATCLWGYREQMHHLGVDPNTYLARFDIPRDADAREGEFISFDAWVAMLEATADELNRPDFGLRLARWWGLDVLGPIAVIARNSRTVLTAIEAVSQYLFVHSPSMRVRRAPFPADPDIGFAFELVEPKPPAVLQGYELSMAVAVRILHLLGGPDAAPSAISFPHPRHAPLEAYQDALGCPVHFDRTWCGFELSAELADRPIAGADTATRRMARKYLDSRYIPPSAPLSDRVADLARNLLPTGQCSVGAIADDLAMPSRTLQRRLAAEGTSCQEVIERERRNLAARYLAVPDMQLSHIAGLVGYTEQSAFNRSCRRWFGKTPRQYRAAMR
jgi:AraC-like DNA-binding protein